MIDYDGNGILLLGCLSMILVKPFVHKQLFRENNYLKRWNLHLSVGGKVELEMRPVLPSSGALKGHAEKQLFLAILDMALLWFSNIFFTAKAIFIMH